MNILYIYCHPLPESFQAAIRRVMLMTLYPKFKRPRLRTGPWGDIAGC